MSFWDIVWFIVISFAFIAYLMVLFMIITDLFRDPKTSGVAKAIWIVALIFLPLLTSLIYLIARGPGMAERSEEQGKAAKQRSDQYIREVASASPADTIAKAKELLDQGTITDEEFQTIKTKALA